MSYFYATLGFPGAMASAIIYSPALSSEGDQYAGPGGKFFRPGSHQKFYQANPDKDRAHDRATHMADGPGYEEVRLTKQASVTKALARAAHGRPATRSFDNHLP